MNNKSLPPISIIGAGAVGSSLAFALHHSGYPILAVISKSLVSARKLCSSVNSTIASTRLEKIPPETRLIIIAVPDSAIPEIDRQLSKVSSLSFKQLLVLHTSGINSATILKELSKKGVSIAAVHPIQTFPKPHGKILKPVLLDGIYYGVDCKKKDTPKIKQLIQNLNGNVIFIPAHLRPLYHAACVFSSSYVVVLLNAIERLSKQLHGTKDWYHIFQPLFNAAIENTLKNSAGMSLTGPIVRNDVTTLKSHLKAIKKFAPELIPLYTVCAKEVARVAHANGLLTKKDFNKITKIFRVTK
ncbi:MAG: DUF2520 domain-containing protein [Bacteroidetes bacterium]|nr:MAG: DUF2520 domain-containing protein [Bacteroidota bacterium]